jgi:ABC-2 type transport system permease protein
VLVGRSLTDLLTAMLCTLIVAVVGLVVGWTRQLVHNPYPSAAIHAWPMQHPVTVSLLWSLAQLAVFATLAAWLYKRRTTE